MDSCPENTLELYISQWRINALQHFNDGDYTWICDLIKQTQSQSSYHRVLEIGCGAGYSTLVFALNGFDVLAVDTNPAAIKYTMDLLEENSYTTALITSPDSKLGDEDVHLWKVDLIEDTKNIKEFVNKQAEMPVDIIVLCNPGGKIGIEITDREYKYLLCGGFSKTEIIEYLEQGQINLLHKWAIIYAAFALSLSVGKPLLIVERDSCQEIQQTLQQIQYDTDCRMIWTKYRPIQNAPKDGVKLGSLDGTNDEQTWGAALFFPD